MTPVTEAAPAAPSVASNHVQPCTVYVGRISAEAGSGKTIGKPWEKPEENGGLASGSYKLSLLLKPWPSRNDVSFPIISPYKS